MPWRDWIRTVEVEPRHVQLRDQVTDYQVYDRDKQLVISFPGLEVGDAIEVRWTVRAGIPTVVLAGERDRLTPARWSRMYHERIPGAALDVVPRAGHMLAYEATDRVVEHLEDLLLGRPLRSSPTP